MIIHVGFNSPAFKQPNPPAGITPGGSEVGFETEDEVEKSGKPLPAGATENELLVQTLTAAVQSLAVTCAFALTTMAKAKIEANSFFMTCKD